MPNRSPETLSLLACLDMLHWSQPSMCGIDGQRLSDAINMIVTDVEQSLTADEYDRYTALIVALMDYAEEQRRPPKRASPPRRPRRAA